MQSLKHDKTMAGHVSDSVHELETHMLRYVCIAHSGPSASKPQRTGSANRTTHDGKYERGSSANS